MKYVKKMTGACGAIFILFGLSFTYSPNSSADCFSLLKLPAPVVSIELEEEGLKYSDSVEIFLLRFIQALTLGHPEKYGADLRLSLFFEREGLTDISTQSSSFLDQDGIELRKRWTRLLGEMMGPLEGLEYAKTLPVSESQPEGRQMLATWDNIQTSFELLFPPLLELTQTANGPQIKKICDYYGNGFACNLFDVNLFNIRAIGGRHYLSSRFEKQISFSVLYLDQPYLKFELTGELKHSRVEVTDRRKDFPAYKGSSMNKATVKATIASPQFSSFRSGRSGNPAPRLHSSDDEDHKEDQGE
jgi:hypothetical protein